MKAVISPQEARERLVAYYMRAFNRAYGAADRAAIERKVIADCELVDRASRDPTPPQRTPGPRPARPDPVAEALAATNTRLTKAMESPVQRYRPRVLHQNPLLISERWAAACARIARILEGSGGSSSLTGGAANAQLPALAKRYLEAYAFYLTRYKPPPSKGVDHNPFRGLSDKDAARLFMRLVEDICDASTGSVMGAWYVK